MKKTINHILIAVRSGIGQAMVVSRGRAYTLPEENTFRMDAANLQRDARKVGKNLKMNFNRQG